MIRALLELLRPVPKPEYPSIWDVQVEELMEDWDRLARRCRSAQQLCWAAADVTSDPVERARLRGKAEGAGLVLAYLGDYSGPSRRWSR